MPDRTNWDARETPGTEAYRERRRRRLNRMGPDAEHRGQTLRGDRPGMVREGQVYSPEEQVEQDEYTFASAGENAKRDIERAKPIERGEASFSTEDAAKALARRRRGEIETVGGRDRYRR